MGERDEERTGVAIVTNAAALCLSKKCGEREESIPTRYRAITRF